jgi:MFS family permease
MLIERFSAAGRAFKSRNYRLLFLGQIISLTGSWMTQIATSWLVYNLTHSSQELGIVSFCGQIPAFLVAPFAGVWIDRWDLRKTLLITQVLAMCQSFALAFFTLRHTITIPLLLGLYIVQGFINGIDIPAKQAIVSQLVTDPNDVGNAIALNSSLFNLARVIGPSIAGFVIAASSEGVCFLIDGISYIAAIAAIFFITVAPKLHRPSKHVLHELHEGLNYTVGFAPLRELLILAAVVSLMGIPFQVLMPVFAKEILHGGPRTLGWLMAGIGCGATVGALILASRRNVLGLGLWIIVAGLGFVLSITLFALSRHVWLSVLLMAGAGLTLVMVNASINTLVQTLADEDKRGRALSLLMMSFLGMVPLGSLLFGELARPVRLGPTWTLTLGAACVALAVARFGWIRPSLRKHIRPVLIARGILPPIAQGLGAQAELTAPPEQAG